MFISLFTPNGLPFHKLRFVGWWWEEGRFWHWRALAMGCVHGKCCCRYDACSDEDAEEQEGFTPCTTNGHGGHGHVLTQSALGSAAVPSHSFRLQYSFLTQRGHYPDSPDRENQDSFCIKTQVQGNPNLHFFGVFDGHGLFGTQCSNFVKERLVDILSANPHLVEDPVRAYNSAFRATNTELHESLIDDSMSGTTAITVLVSGDTLYVANVGDSRAVAGVWKGNSVVAEDLSSDQTPFRRDEYERVKLCGARVLSVDQVEGIKDPNIQTWGDEESDEGDPPRLWVQTGMYPGTAFTRSVGDSTAEKIGVMADPEVLTAKVTPDLLFFVVASDGVFEFLSSETVVNMVAKYADPRDACSAIAAESYRIWLEHESRTDDITIIIVHIKDMCNPGTGVTDGESKVNVKASLLLAEKTAERSVLVGSGVCHPRREMSCDHPGLVDGPMERSTSCVAPSPMHTISLPM